MSQHGGEVISGGTGDAVARDPAAPAQSHVFGRV